LRQVPWEGRVEMSWPSTCRRSGRSCKPSVLHQRCTEFSSPKSAYASSDTDSTCANGTPNSLAPHLVICFPIFGTALAPRPYSKHPDRCNNFTCHAEVPDQFDQQDRSLLISLPLGSVGAHARKKWAHTLSRRGNTDTCRANKALQLLGRPGHLHLPPAHQHNSNARQQTIRESNQPGADARIVDRSSGPQLVDPLHSQPSTHLRARAMPMRTRLPRLRQLTTGW
jgi:hypothetical protein